MATEDRLSNESAAKRAQDGLESVREAANNVDWNAALLRQSREQQMSNGLKILDQMREIQDRSEMDSLNRGMQAQDAIASAIAVTPRGGSLSRDHVAYMNQLRGIQPNADGSPVNGQIMEAGYNPKTGGYGFVTANVGEDGSVSYSPHEYSPAQVYGMMHNYPGIFDENALAEQKAHAIKFDKSLTEDRLGMFAKTATDGYRRIQDRINALNSRKSGGSGLEIAKINADQKEKDRAAKTAKSDREMAFKEKKFEYGVSKDMAKEAKEFFSAIGSDSDKEAFKKKYPELAKSILGIAQGAEKDQQSNGGSDDFVQLSKEDYDKLNDDEKMNYRNRWKEWKQGQAK